MMNFRIFLCVLLTSSPGTGITQDHSEFGNRVHAKSFTGSDGSDCDGSGTMFASLVGGVSMGIAR